MKYNSYMLERTVSKKIQSYFIDFKVILASGARQVGKTTLLQSMIENDRSYVTLDRYQDLSLARNDPEAFFSLYKLPCMIDEVQRAPELFLKIKELVDSSPEKNQVWLTGSQKPQLMKHVSETLAGRVVEVDVFPLSQSEKQRDPYRPSFSPSFETQIPAPWNYKETIENVIIGGYPQVFTMRKENRNAWFNSYINTYLLGDIKSEIKEMDEVQFLKILRILASRVGSSINYSGLSQEAGISAYMIQKIVNLLISYKIIFLLEPYSGNTMKSLVKTPKMYFVDSGLCCHLLGITSIDGFISHQLSGFIFESYVISEIIRNARNNDDYSQFYFYREEGKRRKDKDTNIAEIDLIKKTEGKLYPIEIKLSATPTVDMAKHFDSLNTSEMGTIICLNPRKTLLGKNLLVMPISLI